MTRIQICVGTACYLKGSYHIISRLQELADEHKISDKVDISSIFCLNNCVKGVSTKLDDNLISLSMETVDEFFKDKVLPLAK